MKGEVNSHDSVLLAELPGKTFCLCVIGFREVFFRACALQRELHIISVAGCVKGSYARSDSDQVHGCENFGATCMEAHREGIRSKHTQAAGPRNLDTRTGHKEP